MMLAAFIAAEGVWLGGGLAALLAGRSPRRATRLGVGAAAAGSALAAAPAVQALLGGDPGRMALSTGYPGLSLSLGLDALSAFFLLPILLLVTCTAFYGGEYLRPYAPEKGLGPPWFLFNLVAAAMALLVAARNALLFLAAWELMTLGAAFLVMFEDRRRRNREAGWLYLVATHLGTACLLPFFAGLAARSGSLEFDAWIAHPLAATRGLFFLALAGFGAKAGFMPFHVWLPEAHPAAPSHVSALMSGVIIKTGIYGIVRALGFFTAAPAWWGWVLIGIGAASGVMGVLLALAQHDLKRLLAYHSIENIGIIAMGLGLGVAGLAHGSPAVAALGFAGGLLHVPNHALFKGLLFLGAGSVARAAGTRELDRLGGLLRRMPWTGGFFLLASAAISGLPPLNGFVSEFLIYAAAFAAITSGHPSLAAAGVPVLLALSLIGGLAAACFAKAFGAVFLGTPREGREGREEPLSMLLPMGALALGCAAAGLGAFALPGLLGPALRLLSIGPAAWPAPVGASLNVISIAALGIIALTGLAAWIRRRLRRGGDGAGPTWDCGYARPSARMQYTASSFARPLTAYFQALLGFRREGKRVAGLFPAPAGFRSHTPDTALEAMWRPAFLGARWALARLKRFQNGRVQLYVLYVALALIALIAWKLG